MSGFENPITFGHLLSILGHNHHYVLENNNTLKQIEVYLDDPFSDSNDKYEVLNIDSIPLEYHHYRVIGLVKGNTLDVAFELYADDSWYWDSKVMTVKDFFEDVSDEWPIRLCFDGYNITDNYFDYENSKKVPEKFHNIYIKKAKFVNNISGISTHGAFGYELILECAPPYEYDFYEKHAPKVPLIIE